MGNRVNQIEIITLWYSIRSAGDGSAYLCWFSTEENAAADQEEQEESWGEPCYGSIQSFRGSGEEQEALKNDKVFVNKRKLKEGMIIDYGGELVKVTHVRDISFNYFGADGRGCNGYIEHVKFLDLHES
ncbi:MAG: hypothetical protein ACKO96_05585 [Flammeovirgaceae bacterium]